MHPFLQFHTMPPKSISEHVIFRGHAPRSPSFSKVRSMKFIQNYQNEHTKFNYGMLIVVILYEIHTSHFAVHALHAGCAAQNIRS